MEKAIRRWGIIWRGCSSQSLASQEGIVHNRNERGLERLCIAQKPDGWHLEKAGRSFWHKIEVTRSSKHVMASVVHNSGSVPVSCSTKEWALRKHLYTTNDTSAYVNLGRIFAIRCLEAGINEMACFLERKEGGKVDKLLKELEAAGISLTEPPSYKHPQPSDMKRPEKPWQEFD